MIKDIDSELFGEKPKLEKYHFDLEAYLRFKKYETQTQMKINWLNHMTTKKQ